MGREDFDWVEGYRNDPERLERKQQEKRKRAGDRHEQGRENKIRRQESRRALPASDDWLLHRGNVHFARDRSSFCDDYVPISATATSANNSQQLSVIGIGTVKLDVQRQLSQAKTSTISWFNVLHIPSARCNGISIPGMEAKCRFRQRKGYWTFTNPSTNGAVMCGDDLSGRSRLFIGYGSSELDETRHVTCNGNISISADYARMLELRKAADRAQRTETQSAPATPAARRIPDDYDGEPHSQKIRRMAEKMLEGTENPAMNGTGVCTRESHEVKRLSLAMQQQLPVSRPGHVFMVHEWSEDWLLHCGNIHFTRDAIQLCPTINALKTTNSCVTVIRRSRL